MACIKSLDILGPNLNFNIKNNRVFKTEFGGMATLFLLGIAILAFFGFGRDIFEKTQPRVTFNRITDKSDIPIKILNQSNFLFSIYDQYSNEPIPEFDRRFEVYYDFLDFRGEGMIDTNFRNPFQKCTNETLKLYSEYLNVDPFSYYCFPLGSNRELMGVMTQGKSSLVRLQLDFCKNKTDIKKGISKTDCYTREETQKFLSSKRIQMNYLIETANIDTINYEKPSSRYVYSNSINTNSFSWTRLNILFKKTVIDTDMGFFIKDNNLLNVMAIESIISESYYSPETDTVFSFLIGNSPWKEIYTRSYIKIQDVFAMMGGFINAALIILKLVVEHVTKPKFVDLFNEIYKYEVRNSYNNFKKKQSLKSSTNSIIKKNTTNSSITIQLPTSFQDKKYSNTKRTQTFNSINSEKMRLDLISASNDTRSLIQVLKNKKNKMYRTNMSNLKKSIRCLLSSRKNVQLKFYNFIEEKLKKIISFEQLIKTTKYVKFLKGIFLEDHQNEIIKLCQLPKKNKVSSPMNLEQISEKMLKGVNREKLQNNPNLYGIDTKLFEIVLA